MVTHVVKTEKDRIAEQALSLKISEKGNEQDHELSANKW